MSSDFGNLRDDNARLEQHTKHALEELADWSKKMNHEGIDARAIYTALRVFQTYYYELGRTNLGPSYMFATDKQASKLANKMLSRDL